MSAGRALQYIDGGSGTSSGYNVNNMVSGSRCVLQPSGFGFPMPVNSCGCLAASLIYCENFLCLAHHRVDANLYYPILLRAPVDA